MDTPERGGQQHPGTAFSRVEDSPVFSYISSLSPIKPVKSLHITQTLHSWNFSSIPSVFTSPHLNTQKECRLSIRYPILDLPAAEIPTDNGDDKNLTPGVSNLVKLSECVIDVQENCGVRCSLNEAPVDPPEEECPSLPVKLPRSLEYYCGSPNHNTTPCCGTKVDFKRVRGCLVDFVHSDQDEQKDCADEIEIEGTHHHGESKDDVPGSDWENLIGDDSVNLFLFDSSIESEACKEYCQRTRDHVANYFTSSSSNISEHNINDPQKGQQDVSLGQCLQNFMLELPGDHAEEVEEQTDSEHTPQVAPSCPNKIVISGQVEKMDDESGHHWPLSCQVNYQHHRVFRRRCLVFEVAGSNTPSDSKNNSTSFPVNIKSASGDRQLTSSKHGLGPQPHVLPSIGLHLNSLAATSKERILTEDKLPSGRQLMSISCSPGTCSSLTTVQNHSSSSLVAEKATCASSEVESFPAMQNSLDTPTIGTEELNHSSPKKKKCKQENGGENEACKRCNCKKSKCLKLYCECFAAGVYCVEPCACQGCLNKPIHEDTVLATRKQIESRNPLAFAPKVVRTSVPAVEISEDTNKTPASARHKRGCNCKKSSCLKKYCECYQGGVGCSISCRCEGCKNKFGKRDCLLTMGNEDNQHEEEKLDVCETDGDNQIEIQHDPDVHKDDKHFPESVPSISPSFQICRPSVGLPFLSSGKPPRSSLLSIGSSPLLNTCRTLKKSGIVKSRFEKHFQIVPEDETPEILRGNSSPINVGKVASPNRKRISPPHHEIRLSPSRKCGRKLILRSIPSFPPLTNDAINELPINYPKPSTNS
uniref:Protein lin-54 n=1 Tax=Anthurium amnicola TaxID=1678845 RepID=A0A1D1Z8B6_9ARAE